MVRRRPGRAEPGDPDLDLGPPADPESVARNIVLTKLTGQPRSRRELADALASRNVPEDVAVRVLDRFSEVGLVDDAAFAEAWVRSRQTSRGLSKRALSHELRRKGVDDETVRDAVSSVDAEQERVTARMLVDRKLRSTRGVGPAARFRRLTAMLARKGYPPGVAMQVVREAIEADEAMAGRRPGDDFDPDDSLLDD